VFAPMHQLVPGVATFYMVNLIGISVGGKQLDIPPAAFPKLSLPEAAYSALRSAFRSAMSAYALLPPNKDDGLDTCYNFTGFRNVTVPKVALTFSGGATIDFDVPSGVLVEDCLAFYGDKGLFGIIGNVNGWQRVGFGSGRVIIRPSVKRMQVEICICTRVRG
jgi:hypothetical protein